MAVLEPAMTDEPASQPKRISEACAGGVAVQISLFDPDEAVLAFTRGFKAEQLLNDEVFGMRFEPGTTQRSSVAEGWFVRVDEHEV